MLVVFLLMAGALFFGVVKFLKTRPDQGTPKIQAKPAVAPQETKNPSGADPKEEEPKPAADKEAETSAIPTPPANQATLIEPPPNLPPEIEKKSPGMEALGILEKFVAAKSLSERLPLIETKSPENELAATCLAGPLPPAPKMLLEFQESTAVEGVVDFYYNVDFEMEDGKPNPQTILVRTRGGVGPRVVVDPFLDLFGGRLAAYAAKPSEKAADFQVIVSAVATCMDPKIPNREKKMTLKLLARDNTKEIALAYFGKMSKIHEMLEDGTYSLKYGEAKSCTVMLRWNTEDNAEYPYLEAIALKALDWNP